MAWGDWKTLKGLFQPKTVLGFCGSQWDSSGLLFSLNTLRCSIAPVSEGRVEGTSCSCSRNQSLTQGSHHACSVPNPMSSEGLSALGEPQVQNEILLDQFWIRTKKQHDFMAITLTQLLELGLVYKPSHEVSTATGAWDVDFDICWTTTATERMAERAGAPVQPHCLLISISSCCHMARLAGALLSRVVTIQFCLIWDFSGIA